MPKYLVKINGNDFEVELKPQSGKFIAVINGKELDVISHKLGNKRSLLLINGEANEIDVRGNGFDESRSVFIKGQEIPAEIEDFNLAQLRKTAGMSSNKKVEKIVKSPMPGLVIEFKVKPGDEVVKEQPLVIIEAMKMENVIKAKADGIVKKILVETGDQVEKDAKILEFE